MKNFIKAVQLALNSNTIKNNPWSDLEFLAEYYDNKATERFIEILEQEKWKLMELEEKYNKLLK